MIKTFQFCLCSRASSGDLLKIYTASFLLLLCFLSPFILGYVSFHGIVVDNIKFLFFVCFFFLELILNFLVIHVNEHSGNSKKKFPIHKFFFQNFQPKFDFLFFELGFSGLYLRKLKKKTNPIFLEIIWSFLPNKL